MSKKVPKRKKKMRRTIAKLRRHQERMADLNDPAKVALPETAKPVGRTAVINRIRELNGLPPI